MIGETISHYEIISRLGQGGMGEVYLADDTQLDRQVALKFLSESLWDDSEAKERLIREAKAASKLDHPNIVTIHGIEEVEGRLFIVMACVKGTTIDRYVEALGRTSERIVNLALQIADGLKHAHLAGIVHRDLKPGNILVDDDGRARILDFGVARVSGASRLTQAGMSVGTPAYMSPEVIQGEDAQPASDIYSLGVVLYQMLSGQLPFEADSQATLLYSILEDEPPSLTENDPAIPPALQAVIMQCLAKCPDQRYPNCDALASALRDSLTPGSMPKEAETSYDTPSVTPSLSSPTKSKSRNWPLGIAAAMLLTVSAYLVVYLGLFPSKDRTPGVIRSIAVLPLDNYSGDPSQDYFAEGMTDELTANLATISQLRVISRGSAMQFDSKNRPAAPEIAKALKVDALVEGSVTRAGDRVRITAQLVDARADKNLWAHSFERSSSDVLALQAELASAIANEINVQLTPSEASRLAAAPSVNPAAHDAYLRGRYFFNRPSDENLKKAIAQFQEAVKLSPDFAPAYSGLSDAYLWAGYNEGFLTASEARPLAKEAAEKAVALDSNSAEAHTSLAVFKLFYEYDWAGCEQEFRRAIALNPSYAFAHDQFGNGLAYLGRFDESIAEGKRAAALDPLSPQILVDNCTAFVLSRDYDTARELAKSAGNLDPTYFFPVMVEGWINCEAGEAKEAIPHLKKASTMDAPDFVTAWLAYAYGVSGDTARAKAQLEELKRISLNGEVSPFNLALVSLGLGDYAHAVQHLEEAYVSDSQWLGWLRGGRVFDPLRSEPRFTALLQKLGFEPPA